MRAVGVREFGAIPELLDLPDPVPGPGELLVRLDYAGVNPFDWKIADGALRGGRPHVFPLVLGVDGAGVVEATGPGASRFRIGERVVGHFLHDPIGRGTYCERTVVPERNALVPIPASVSARDAASLPTAGMTALTALDQLALPARSRLALVGASGGVGSFVVPFAARAGLEVVAIARRPSEARLRALGAIHFVDFAGPDPVGAVRALVPDGVDALLDFASDPTAFGRWQSVVRPDGIAASTMHSARSSTRVRTIAIDLQPTVAVLDRLLRAVREGTIRPPVDRVVPLADAPAVVAEGRRGELRGKTVIELARAG